MITAQPLKGCVIGISISESPDLRERGFDRSEMNRCIVRLSESLLAAGARLAFGHDWRPGGVMEAIAALAGRYFPIAPKSAEWVASDTVPIINRVAAPDMPYLHSLSQSSMNPMAKLLDGIVDAKQVPSSNEKDRRLALTEMRQELARMCHLRICLGGKLADYSGKMPGIIEEAVETNNLGRPVLAGGIFGGAAELVSHAFLGQSSETQANAGIDSLRILQNAAKGVQSVTPVERLKDLARSSSIEETIELMLHTSIVCWNSRKC